MALGGGTAEASTATISGTPPMLPVGTTVWLTKTVGPSDQAGFGEQPFYFAVRERAGGRILFGGLVRHSGQDLGPFATGAMTPFCSYFSVCHVFTHYSIEVRADTIVNVRSGDTADIKLDGTEYALSVTVVTAGEHIAGCVISDFYAAPPIRLAFEAKDLQGSAHP